MSIARALGARRSSAAHVFKPKSPQNARMRADHFLLDRRKMSGTGAFGSAQAGLPRFQQRRSGARPVL
jgi:hypothetical protein